MAVTIARDSPFAVDVECDLDDRFEETPRRFRLAGVDIDVAEVVDRWPALTHRYFKVRDHAGDFYILRHDVTTATWELTFFRQRPFNHAPIQA